ncbi:MAG: response regulator [Phycisphaerae bacterium]|nr:response regulator [Phycisphaerae bacterium]
MSILNGRTILIADDERYISSTLAAKIRATGARVFVACDGAEAFQIACAEHPDLILSDYQMPVLSGLEFCQKLRAHPETCNIPVVMLTARGHRLSDADLANTNIRLMLAKPFSVRDVLEALQTLSVGLAA